MPTHTKKPPNAPCLSPTPSGSHTMPQGGSAGPNMIDLANGQPAPSEAATRRRAAACPRCRRAGRDAAFLVKTTYCCSTPAAIASRGARQAEPASTNGRPLSRCAPAPPRARAGHPILATCEARDRAPRVPIGQASVARRIRRGRLRAVLDSLARGESLG